MRSIVTAAAVVCSGAVIAGCAGAPAASTGAGSSPSVAPNPETTDAAGLLSRRLTLPGVGAGSACPVTPVAQIATGLTDPRGKGPLYFGGQMPLGGFPFNKMGYATLGGAQGPILLRGGRIDGAGRLKFSGTPADPTEKAEVPPAPGGGQGSGSWAFYQAILDPGPGNALYVYPSTRGCYGIQVDAPTFQEEIILRAT